MKRVGIVSVVVMLMLALGGCGGERPNDENRSNPAPKNRPPVATGASVQARDDGSYRTTLHGSDPAEVTIRVKNRGDDNTSKGLRSLSLSVGMTSLNKDHNTTLSLTGTYADGTQKDLSAQTQWIVTPQDAIKITGHTLTALKDVNVTLQAQVGDKLSNPVHLEIYWEVDGHRLPPEPDPKVNNATLLGVDVNHNGVRDDVERWIYEKYKNKHPIYIDIAMQAARGYRLVLETPEKAKEIRLKVNGALFCGWYYKKDAYRYNDPTLVHERIDTKVFSKYFNTKERSDTYWQYDRLLSGGVYDLPRSKQRKALCDFNTSKYGK